MATSEVKICNKALTRLGARTISDLTGTGTEEMLCNQFYADTRDLLLTEYDWPFAIGRVQLAQLSGDTMSKYDYKYQLPLNPEIHRLIGLINIADETYEDLDEEWVIEGKELHTDQTPCAIKYIKTITDPNKFTRTFIEATALRLASQICIKLTQDMNLYQLITQEYMAMNLQARATDGSTTKAYINDHEDWD